MSVTLRKTTPGLEPASAGGRLIRTIRHGLVTLADPDRAAQQQAYMKSSFSHAGLDATTLRQLVATALREQLLTAADEWLTTAALLWRDARVREERYAALQILLHKPCRKWLTPDVLPLLREMIETGAWWDFIDNIAANHVGELLRTHPHDIKPELMAWANDSDLWVRRTAILAQLKFKATTDLVLLHHAIQGSVHDPDFFARKAIGWALRAYSREDPDWVVAYVTTHASTLSPLSRREACKLLLKSGALSAVPAPGDS